MSLPVFWHVKRFSIWQSSMAPHFIRGDRVFALSLKMAGPIMRGDVVFFKKNNEEFLRVKRVIGLPGETIEIVKGKVRINGQNLNDLVRFSGDDSNYGPTFIPPNQYFLIGDNRINSRDSRFFGPVHIENILYKAQFKF